MCGICLIFCVLCPGQHEHIFKWAMSHVLQQTISQLSSSTVGRLLIPDGWVIAAALGIPGLISETMEQRPGKWAGGKQTLEQLGSLERKGWRSWVNACMGPTGAAPVFALRVHPPPHSSVRPRCCYSLSPGLGQGSFVLELVAGEAPPPHCWPLLPGMKRAYFCLWRELQGSKPTPRL